MNAKVGTKDDAAVVSSNTSSNLNFRESLSYMYTYVVSVIFVKNVLNEFFIVCYLHSLL